MANRKRNSNSEEEIRAKIRKLESQLNKRKNRRIIYSTSSSDEDEQEQVSTRSTALTHTDGAPSTAPATGTRGEEATRADGTRDTEVAPAPGTSGAPRQPAPTASSSATTSATYTPPEVASTSESSDLALDEDVLLLLGDAPEPETEFGKPVHKDIAARWQDILAKGLPKDILDKLLKEYLIPINCDLLVSPILNPEVKVALSESMTKRDAALSAKQKQIGIALAALSKAVELIINKESCTQKILKPLGDACRILCDSHFCDTRTRRGFVIAAVNADLKDTVTESKRDKFLFGSNIAEQLKSAKTIKQSGSVLKQSKNEKSHKFNKNNFIKHKNNNSYRLNWTTTPRRAPNKQDFSRPATRRPATRASFQQREKSERSPARKSRRH